MVVGSRTTRQGERTVCFTTRDGPRARQKAEQRGQDRAVVLAHEGRSLIQQVDRRYLFEYISMRPIWNMNTWIRMHKTVAQERRR